MANNFQARKASRAQAFLKIAVQGPSGAGKTFSALEMAFGLAGSWEDVCVVDSENRSADLYSGKGPYSVIELDAPYSPERYCQAIDGAIASGAKVIVIDTISKEWDGEGGCLEWVNQLQKNSKSQFTPWEPVTKAHNAFINKILQAPCHVIVTIRSKIKYELVNGKPEKLGFEPIQRPGTEYEFGFLFEITHDHVGYVGKQRATVFNDRTPLKMTAEIGSMLREWNSEGGQREAKAGEIPADIQRIIAVVKQGEGLLGIKCSEQYPGDYDKFVKAQKESKLTGEWAHTKVCLEILVAKLKNPDSNQALESEVA